MMKTTILSLLVLLAFVNCNKNNNKWQALLVNDSLEGWHIFQDNGNKKGWVVEDSVLIFNGISDMESGEGDASLLSDAQFIKVLKFSLIGKLHPGGNSGFMWGVQEDGKYKYPYQTGPEIQILDPAIYDDPASALGGEVEIENASGRFGGPQAFCRGLIRSYLHLHRQLK